MEADYLLAFVSEYFWPFLGTCLFAGFLGGFCFGIKVWPNILVGITARWQYLLDKQTIRTLCAYSREAFLLTGQDNIREGYETIIHDRKLAMDKRNEIAATLKRLKPLYEITLMEAPKIDFDNSAQVADIHANGTYEQKLALAGVMHMRALKQQMKLLDTHIRKADPGLRNFLFRLALTKHCPTGEKLTDDQLLDDLISIMNEEMTLIEESTGEAKVGCTTEGAIAALKESTGTKALQRPPTSEKKSES